MPKAEWGTKRLCPTTGKRFYDLNANPIVSPYTGLVVNIDTVRGRSIMADAADGAKKLKGFDEDDDLLLDDDVEGDDADLADEVLEDDDEDNVSFDDLGDVAANDDE
ncbi:hypothetical protein BVG79_01992 [Ketogulonicigenium robustum]|uniref:TIGR02300 family protein n=1 Tax=Ketogulonicigenium robustum TaxID=92947 RepID=A0A1W6P1L9_9RHOB|nr:TIGR02300 family protein [Ketogulonicigenium robustum]ARO15334.1 hypothetical protein BVG79_01992 [Ketogulonicigenium robustum]